MKYHDGERAVQQAAGEEEMARQNSVMTLDALMSGAKSFLRAQQLLVIAHRDMQQRLWASILFGRAGFVSASDDGRTVMIDRASTFRGDDGPWVALVADAPIGLLAIELSTRRRLRVNGWVEGGRRSVEKWRDRRACRSGLRELSEVHPATPSPFAHRGRRRARIDDR